MLRIWIELRESAILVIIADRRHEPKVENAPRRKPAKKYRIVR